MDGLTTPEKMVKMLTSNWKSTSIDFFEYLPNFVTPSPTIPERWLFETKSIIYFWHNDCLHTPANLVEWKLLYANGWVAVGIWEDTRYINPLKFFWTQFLRDRYKATHQLNFLFRLIRPKSANFQWKCWRCWLWSYIKTTAFFGKPFHVYTFLLKIDTCKDEFEKI